MASVKNISKRAHILPHMGDGLEGLVGPGDVLLNVPSATIESDHVQNGVVDGELVVIPDAGEMPRRGRPRKDANDEGQGNDA